ncbi:type I methionyl aminopeptidase [Metamycoplasma hyosynoviae]|uniref:Methionine aminopeptidase n=1 Tax=Metamycoplasma hyosynoviae TaxID=29559 RepID=A0A4P1QG88_9BACT|nr:type I methionyl aminopeptidase [Metamycoplasma hyosynoviae]ASI53926.1 methionine aminopeptidase [Metamycoplasma hyosynoviae]MDC8913667.1 type I methionyl aminopeptidase [Metamycoplasma hyosynoviae]MDC8963161.1 type I methionyl aminopeptidase [Metamycoplasma hyosynoviae]MDD7895699.1 type I methionyl aminopeptidase [Metamycoplasma hyosynoviae]MDD7897835.1 type I methionyl aminopeptidase [Metamycoplasma hyosynoviae]
MIKIKTLEEIEKIKKACSILAEVKKIVYDFISPGVSLKEIDSVAFKEIIKRQGKPAFLGQYGFPNTCCISVNEELIHGIPSDYVVKNGDIVKIDMGVIWDGYYSDSAFTKGVGNISEQDKKLIQVAKDAFYAGFNAIKVGKRIGDISFAIGSYIKSQGFYTPEEYTGHGIGKELHEDPIVDNDGVPGTGPIIRNGMVICIEPMILQKSKNVVVKKDRWTVVDPYGLNTSHYEQTVLIYDNKAYILTGDNI